MTVSIYEKSGQLYNGHKDEIKEVIKTVYKLMYLAKNEGLLALEGIIYQEKFIEHNFLSRLVMRIVDGVPSEELETLFKNYIITEENEKRKLIKSIYKDTLIYFQKSYPRSTYLIKDYILSMFPESLEGELSQYIDELVDYFEKQSREEKEKGLLKKFLNINIDLNRELQEKLDTFSDKVILGHTDLEVQRFLREIDNSDLEILLLGTNNAFRNKILDNMSSRLQLMVMEDTLTSYERTNYYEYKKVIENDIEKVLERAERLIETLGW